MTQAAAISAEARASAEEKQYVTLGIEQEVFAIPVEAVLEILGMRRVSRIPEAPPYMIGLIDLRGRSVPVLDLRTKLGLPPVAATDSTRILVIEAAISGRRLVLGLVADRVIEVLAISARDIEPPPDIGVRWRSEYIRGVGRRDSGFIVIFDLPKLFSTSDAAAIEASALRQ
jgi:purine-binding chemotaxis protein CheW